MRGSRRQAEGRVLIPGILALVIAAVGAAATLHWWKRGRRDVLRWPIVTGRILERSVRVPTNRHPTRGRRAWEPVVRYAYEVDGRAYESANIYLPWPRRDRKENCEAFVASLPAEVTVRYDPKNPTTSVLFPAPLEWTLWLLAGCALALVIGLMFLVTG